MIARLGEWAVKFGLQIQPAESTLIARGTAVVLRVKDLFTTREGSWEPDNQEGSLPQWARDAYLKPWGAPNYFDDAGGAVHLFGLVLDEQGQPVKTGPVFRFWSDGYAKLGDPAYTGYVDMTPKSAHGWANLPMTTKDSSYSPPNRGPWCWYPVVAGMDPDVVTGGGLWKGGHKSTFAVWQMEARAVVEPPVDPPTGDLEQRIGQLEVEVGRLLNWAETLNL